MSPAAHNLHRHAAFKYLFVLKAVYRRLFRLTQGFPECVILFPIHGTVDIIRRTLVITGGKIGVVHIHRFKADNRCRRIIKMQVFMSTQLFPDAVKQGI